MLATKKIRQVKRLMPAARTEMLLDAFGPKCLVMTSIHMNDSHEMRIPPSRAIHGSCSSVLLAKRFMQMTLTTNKVTTAAGIDRSSSRNSRNSFFTRAPPRAKNRAEFSFFERIQYSTPPPDCQVYGAKWWTSASIWRTRHRLVFSRLVQSLLRGFLQPCKNIQRSLKFIATPYGAALNITRGTIYVPQDFSMYQSKTVFVKRRRQKRQQPCKNMQKIDIDYTKLFDGYRNRSKKAREGLSCYTPPPFQQKGRNDRTTVLFAM